LAVLVAIFMFAGAAGVFMRSGALADEQGRATAASLSLVRDTVTPAIQGRPPQTPEAVSALGAALAPSLNVGDVLRVRIWARDRSLAFSTQGGDIGGSTPSSLTSVLGDRDVSGVVKTTIPDIGPGGAVTSWVVVAPLRDGKTLTGAVEVDRSYSAIETAANDPWLYVALAGIGAASLFLVILAVSFVPRRRRRTSDERATVPGSPVPDNKVASSGEPPNEEGEELTRMDQAKLVARVQKAESSRRAMELQLDQLRQQIMSGDLGVAEDKIRELEDERRAVADRATAAEVRVAELEARLSPTPGAQATPIVPEADLVAAHQAARTARADADSLAVQLRDSEAKNRTLENALADARAQMERTTAQVTELDNQMRVDTARSAASDEREVERAAVETSTPAVRVDADRSAASDEYEAELAAIETPAPTVGAIETPAAEERAAEEPAAEEPAAEEPAAEEPAVEEPAAEEPAAEEPAAEEPAAEEPAAEAGENDWLEKVEAVEQEPTHDPTLRQRLEETARRKKGRAALDTAAERSQQNDDDRGPRPR
jgi:hypothetical protein